MHEIAHVLGFGVSRQWRARLDNPSQGFDYLPGQNTLPDTHFVGTAANSAFRRGRRRFLHRWRRGAGGERHGPVYGSAAGLDAHWREAVFASELMTPSITSGEPLSRVTIAALADLGYSVSYGQAESYTLPGTTSSRLEAAGREIDLGDDVWEGPVYEVDIPEQNIPVITP